MTLTLTDWLVIGARSARPSSRSASTDAGARQTASCRLVSVFTGTLVPRIASIRPQDLLELSPRILLGPAHRVRRSRLGRRHGLEPRRAGRWRSPCRRARGADGA